MNALRTRTASDAFEQNSLSGFVWREAGEGGLTPIGRRVPRCDDRTAARFDHIVDDEAREMKQGHRIDLEILTKNFGIDLPKAPEGSAHGVMDLERSVDLALPHIGILEPMTPSTTHLDFPADADSITPDWLTRVLHQSGTIRRSRVRTCAAAKMGAAGFIGELARIELSYTIAEERAPRTLIAKFSNRDPDQRAVFHGIGFYERENRFYRDLAVRTPFPTPDCYHAEIDLESGQSILLLEDLADSVTVDVAKGCTLKQSELVIRHMAEFHARWWESEELRNASYIPPADQLLRIYHFTFQQQWPGLPERLTAIDPALVLSTELLELGDWLCRSSGDVFAPLARSPFTLVHMDIHLDNLAFRPTEQDRPLVVFDWQTYGLGRGVMDLTYFMISAVPIEIRRQAEKTLLGNYHRHLTQHGVSNYTLDECTNDYRRAAVWNLLIFSAVAADVEPDPTRQIYVKAILPRLCAFFEDHSMAAIAAMAIRGSTKGVSSRDPRPA